MKPSDNIEELFEAAKRHEKDMKRQQRLSDLVDQWAASENATSKSSKRRTIWATMGVVAGILLMVSIGLRTLQPEMPADTGIQLAKNEPSTNGDSIIAHYRDSVNSATDVSDLQDSQDFFCLQKVDTKKNNTHIERDYEESTMVAYCNPTGTIDTTLVETPSGRILISENGTKEDEEVTVAATEKKVFIRTSNRLVGNRNKQQRPETPSNDSQNQPLLAFSGAGTSVIYDLGKINF